MVFIQTFVVWVSLVTEWRHNKMPNSRSMASVKVRYLVMSVLKTTLISLLVTLIQFAWVLWPSIYFCGLPIYPRDLYVQFCPGQLSLPSQCTFCQAFGASTSGGTERTPVNGYLFLNPSHARPTSWSSWKDRWFCSWETEAQRIKTPADNQILILLFVCFPQHKESRH